MNFLLDLKTFRINLFGRSFFLKIIIWTVRIDSTTLEVMKMQLERIKRVLYFRYVYPF